MKRVSVKKDIGGRYNKEADSSSELQIERNESLIHFCWFWKQPFTTQQSGVRFLQRQSGCLGADLTTAGGQNSVLRSLFYQLIL